MIKHKILNLLQQDSAEYFPLAWQMLTSRPPLMMRVTVAEVVWVEVVVEEVVEAVVTVEVGGEEEMGLLEGLVLAEVAGEEEMDL